MADKLASLTIGKALIIGLGLAVAYYFMFYDDGKNLQTLLTNTKTELEKNQKEIKSINDAIKDAARFKDIMAKLGEEMGRILKAIPEKLTPIELMKIISNEAKGVGTEINRLNSPMMMRSGFNTNKDTTVFYEPVLVDVELSGTYNQLMLFMANLTRLDKIVTVRKIKLSTSDSKNRNNPEIKMAASLQAYRYISEPPPDPKAKGAKAKGAVKK